MLNAHKTARTNLKKASLAAKSDAWRKVCNELVRVIKSLQVNSTHVTGVQNFPRKQCMQVRKHSSSRN